MAFLDALVGGSGVKKQKRLADSFVRKMYDAGTLNPARENAQLMALEGISEDPIRKQVVKQAFSRDSDAIDVTGGNQGAALAAQQNIDADISGSIADSEAQLGIQDEMAKMEGREKFASIVTEQNKIRSQREAKLEENEMLMEKELQDRKRRLIGGVLKTGLSAATLAATGGFSSLKEGADVVGDGGGFNVPKINLPSFNTVESVFKGVPFKY